MDGKGYKDQDNGLRIWLFFFLFLVEHGPKREEKSKNSKDKGGNGGIVIKSV